VSENFSLPSFIFFLAVHLYFKAKMAQRRRHKSEEISVGYFQILFFFDSTNA
jgi:hypothetical protein